MAESAAHLAMAAEVGVRRRRAGGVVAIVFAVVALAGVTPAVALERGRPGERLSYSAPTTSPECSMNVRRDLVLADADATDATVVARCIEDAEPPSPDGEVLAAQSLSDTTTPARLTQAQALLYAEDDGCGVGGVAGDDIDWSPDGTLIAAALFRSSGPELGLFVHDRRFAPIGPDAARSRRQLVAGATVSLPSWHPMNDTIAFTIGRSATGDDIDVVRVDGTGRRTLLGGPTDDSAPAFSPDGSRLAFVRGRGTGARPYVAAADGTGARQVADVTVRGTVSWTPDGTRLAVALTDGIATIDVAGGAVTRLTTGDHLSPTLFDRRSTSGADGYGLAGADGRFLRFGAMCADLDRGQMPEQPYVAVAATPDRSQAWYVTAGGRVEPTGSRPLLGNAPAGAAPTVGIAATSTGGGYWVATSRGEVFSFGDAGFHGSLGSTRLNRPITGIAVTPSGQGYWLVASDGGIFSFGDARFHGSTGATRLNQPVVGMAPTPSGGGYWLFAGDGGIFSFGDARFYGSTGAQRLNAPVFAMAPTTAGTGYWLFARDGGVFTFGAARYHGSTGDQPLDTTIIGAFNRGATIR